jgi:signal transduction histidine kinase
MKNYYLMAAIIAFAFSIIVIDIVSHIINAIDLDVNNDHPTPRQLALIGTLLLLLFVIGVVAFLVMFSLLTRNKSEYVKSICREVGRIAEDDENVLVEERGGDELEEISRSINRMSLELREKRERERELEKQRTELITNVSHDLRSPLTSIIGYVRLLKENGCRDEEKFREYIEVTDRRLEGLEKLVNELFELTKLESPDIIPDLEEGDVSGVVKQFGFEMGLILEQEGLTLRCELDEEPFVMMLDYERFARVMQNLFANVMKYAVKGTEVVLGSKVKGDSFEITLTNVTDGREIDTASMFNRFYKADAARTDTSGAGLGLAIARRIVELHGGKISAETGGNTMTVKIVMHRSDSNG